MESYCTKTCKGRVVYNRKKHEFKNRDVARIASKIQHGIFVVSVKEKYWQSFARYIAEFRRNDTGFAFGSGRFGGGGATRDFDIPSVDLELPKMRSSTIIMVLKERENGGID